MYNLALTGNPTGSGYQQAAIWDHIGFGANVGGPTPYEMGFDVARGLWNISYDLEHLQLGLFGWPFLFGLALVAVPFVAGRATKWDWLLVASCLCVVAAYGCYWASGVTGGFPRYWYGIVPWLIILAARGLEELVSWPSCWARRPVAWPALVFPAIFLAVMVYFNVEYFIPVNVTEYSNPGGAAVAAVKSARIHHAIIFQHQSSPQNSEFDQVFAENSPLLDGDILWAIDRGLTVDRRVMQKYPGRSYYRLNGTTLKPFGP